ncbi:MAG: hypothetical protein FJ008_04940 [Chloroflexi bacterium]|nr:hypothetical protein [Chloroflexota bacterium]MBM3172596.1 hypothetical protein [Chloroflexota bacterium]MBM3175754.1 hypothetical protein [Chloroflexota bacterium]MBM4451037.1 hypothetical protein [Chloroflexota bacterium]
MKKIMWIMLLPLMLISGCIYISGEMPKIGLAPKITVFEATPPVINAGDVAYLRWSVSNADHVSIDNGIGSVAASGTMPISPGSNTTYTLTARNLGGEAEARTQIIVHSPPATGQIIPAITPPTIAAFYANRSAISPGEQVTLSWEVLAATDVAITSIGKVKSRDNMAITPSGTTTYMLTAVNSAGQSVASITVTVGPSATPGTPGELVVVLPALSSESGSLLKGGGYLDYTRRESACAGDTDINLASRAFLSFDISALPRNITVKEAILDLSNYTMKGDPSYMRGQWGNMGALSIYHLQYGKFENLGFKAYTDPGKLVANGETTVYPHSPWVPDVKDASNGEPVIQNLIQQGKARCQFRIQFFTSTNWDSTSDMLCFDNATLTVRYNSNR